jgi:hypothetical protein
MLTPKYFNLKTLIKNFTKDYDAVGRNILNAYGLGLGVTCNYYIYNVSIKKI